MNSKRSNKWDYKTVLKYYETSRNQYSQLYPSEKYFLDKLKIDNFQILDIGCAIGGFYKIFSSMGKNIKYTGVDVSRKMIKIARELHPDTLFHSVTKKLDNLELSENSFDLVFSSGVFHLNKYWKQMLTNAYNFTKKYFLVDFRVTAGPTQIGSMKLNYGMEVQKPPTTEYIALNLKELLNAFHTLAPKPVSISIYGYNHPISDDAELKIKTVCMAFFLIQKGLSNPNDRILYSSELPEEFSNFFS